MFRAERFELGRAVLGFPWIAQIFNRFKHLIGIVIFVQMHQNATKTLSDDR
jgi:hypothetical protein